MLGDSWLTEAELRDDVIDRAGLFADGREDPAPRRVGDHREKISAHSSTVTAYIPPVIHPRGFRVPPSPMQLRRDILHHLTQESGHLLRRNSLWVDDLLG